MTAQHSRSPAVVFFFTVVFSLPFGSNTPAYLLLYVVFLLAFPIYVYIATRKTGFTVLAELKAVSVATFTASRASSTAGRLASYYGFAQKSIVSDNVLGAFNNRPDGRHQL